MELWHLRIAAMMLVLSAPGPLPSHLAGDDVLRVNQQVLRVLVSEVRVEILRRLGIRRMTVTDLSRALGLTKPTLLGHLRRLLSASLVRRVEDGRKWVYYELTRAGRLLLQPRVIQIP